MTGKYELRIGKIAGRHTRDLLCQESRVPGQQKDKGGKGEEQWNKSNNNMKRRRT
jgi:hypothetical protein